MYFKPGPKLKEFITSVDLDYEFHPETNLFPYVKWDLFLALGRDICKNGLQNKIELLSGKIIDGRHRYLACIMFNVEPEFVHLPEKTNRLSHVFSKNYHRRDLTQGQRYNLGLAYFKEETIKAKQRKKNTQFVGRDENNKPKRKSSVRTVVGTSEENDGKGKAIVISSEKAGVNQKTLTKVVKIEKAAQKSEEIKNDFEDVLLGNKSVAEVYRKIAPPKNLVNLKTDCKYIRIAPCTTCSGQVAACRLDLEKGKLLLITKCPDPCLKIK